MQVILPVSLVKTPFIDEFYSDEFIHVYSVFRLFSPSPALSYLLSSPVTLPSPYGSISHIHVFLFYEPLILTRAICVTMGLELSTGAWLAGNKDNDFPFPQIHHSPISPPPKSMIDCWEAQPCASRCRHAQLLLDHVLNAVAFCSPFPAFHFHVYCAT